VFRLRISTWTGLACALPGMLACAAMLLPVNYDAGDACFEIPKGTWARRRAGEDLTVLPQQIRLFSGTNLVLRNLDDVPQIFGPTLIMPGQALKLPFDRPAEYQFMCTAHVSGQMTVLVDEAPTSMASRLRWRVRAFLQTISRS